MYLLKEQMSGFFKETDHNEQMLELVAINSKKPLVVLKRHTQSYADRNSTMKSDAGKPCKHNLEPAFVQVRWIY